MSWFYVGLLAAAVLEIVTRVPDTSFWWMVVAGNLLVVALGKMIIDPRVPRILQALRGGQA